MVLSQVTPSARARSQSAKWHVTRKHVPSIHGIKPSGVNVVSHAVAVYKLVVFGAKAMMERSTIHSRSVPMPRQLHHQPHKSVLLPNVLSTTGTSRTGVHVIKLALVVSPSAR